MMTTFILFFLLFARTPSQPEHKSVWNGVYNDTQAARGQDAYATKCSGCHGVNLTGGNQSPLKGDRWMEKWREDNLQSLFNFMSAYMPRNAPRLTDGAYLDIISYVLQQNGFPAGSGELDLPALRNIQIEGKDGPQPVPNNSVVEVVGCLAKVDPDNWALKNGSDPKKTMDSDKTTPDALKNAAAKTLGGLTFALQNLYMLGNFDPGPHDGHKMLAKGALIRGASGNKISVTLLEEVAPTCEH